MKLFKVLFVMLVIVHGGCGGSDSETPPRKNSSSASTNNGAENGNDEPKTGPGGEKPDLCPVPSSSQSSDSELCDT